MEYLLQPNPASLPNCTFHDLIHTQRSADFLCNTAAKVLCSDKQEIINFFEFYWCDLDGNLPLLLVIYVIAIFFIFKYTALAVDEYVADGISKISDWLGFSESLAAVTLLAFANGAGDVITALVAADAEGGVSYNIGALYGAGLFVCSMVVAICIFQSDEPIVYDKMIIYRDIGIYLISTFATIGFAFYGYITWWSSCILLGLYVALVMVVIITERIEKSKLKIQEAERPSMGNGVGDTLLTNQADLQAAELQDEGEEEKIQRRKLSIDAGKAVGLAAMLAGNEHTVQSTINQIDGDDHLKALLLFRTASLRTFLKLKVKMIKEHRDMEMKDRSTLDKISHVLSLPAEIILYLTATPASEEQYSKTRCIVFCIPGTLFTWWIFHPELDMTFIYYALPVGALLMVIFMITLPQDKPPKWFMLLTIMAVASGLMWTKVLVGVLIDMLNTLGVLLNLPEAYLGLTILAVGNALPDALTTVALCQQGAGTMAISGGYAGQLFGYLVGFGVSMLKLTLKEGQQQFNLFDFTQIQDNMLSLVVVGVALLVLGITFIFGVCNNFKMTRGFGITILVIYVVFILGSSVFAIHQAITNP